METDDELAKLLTELRDLAEYVQMMVVPPHTQSETRDEKTGKMVVTEPFGDELRLRRDTTMEQFLEGATELAAAADRVQDWFDETATGKTSRTRTAARVPTVRGSKSGVRGDDGWPRGGSVAVELRHDRRRLRRVLQSVRAETAACAHLADAPAAARRETDLPSAIYVGCRNGLWRSVVSAETLYEGKRYHAGPIYSPPSRIRGCRK